MNLLGRLTVLALGWTLSFSQVVAADQDFNCRQDFTAKKPAQLVAGIEERYAKLQALSGKFTQESFFAGLDRREKSEGILHFLKPGRMDWAYERPEQQRFVADGKTLFYYQVKENQVTLADFKQSFQTDLPVSFLLGVGKLSERFNVKSVCQTSAGVLLSLEPKEVDPSLDRFDLLVRLADYVPIGAKVADLGGNETTIRLSALELNPSLTEKQFAFTIPRGVDIIDRRDPTTLISEGNHAG